MLFRYTETESADTAKLQSGVVVRKASFFRIPCFIVCSALLITIGVLCMVFKPIPQYFTTSICLFICALIPLFFLFDLLFFSLAIGGGKIALKKITFPRTVYAYTDVSWKFQTPDKKQSAVLLFVKNRQIARILPSAPNFEALLSLRHKGTLSSEEKALIRKYTERADTSKK